MKRAATLVSLLFVAGCQTHRTEQVSGPQLDAAATSLNALQARVEICSHNIANLQTVGYKATRVVLSDLPYNNRSLDDGSGGTMTARIGGGVHLARTTTDMTQGPAIQTARPLDLLIQGPGFFATTSTERDIGREYTRAGQFSLNADGQMVLMGRPDMRIEPSICVPCDTTQIKVSSSGRISVLRAGSIEPEEVGQIELSCFVNPEGLKPVGCGLFVETAESGQPLEGEPGADNRGTLHQGMLEGSNVNLITEQVEARRAQQQFEALSRLAFPTGSWASR